jgi:hypothetical protein
MVGLVGNNLKKNVTGSDCGLFQDTTLASAWRDRRKSRKPAFLTAGFPGEIQTVYILNKGYKAFIACAYLLTSQRYCLLGCGTMWFGK